jgi:pimeloyl-ACP methyl ester carboxylesterase
VDTASPRTGMAPAAATAPSPQYGEAERRLWDHFGINPTERFVDLKGLPARLRILEVGPGEPVLFVPGTAGTGPVWGSLLRHLSGYRCLLLDRPGWGFSSPIDYTKGPYRQVVAAVMGDVLDALGLEHTHVVGASIGNLWALRAAQAHPKRIRGVVLLGGGPLVSEISPPKVIRLIASPIGALMVRAGENSKRVKAILRSNGHGPSLESGRIPGEYVEWRVSLGRQTRSMRSERDMVRALLAGKGWKSGLTFEDTELANLRHPVLMVYGTADPVGSPHIWKRFVNVLPEAQLRVIQSAGHVPWLDKPAEVASAVDAFLGHASTGDSK